MPPSHQKIVVSKFDDSYAAALDFADSQLLEQ
jgi:hypothetical protein